jgi:hypothetical protein
LPEVSGIFPCRNGLFKHVHGNTCEIEEDVWLTPADVITRDEVEQPGGEVLLIMLEVAVVEGKGKGSMLRRLSDEDGILD